MRQGADDDVGDTPALYAHESCLMWAPKVYVDENGSVHNVHEELSRGARLECAHCKEKGAVVGCRHAGCRKSFHLPCTLLAEDICALYTNHYAMYCGAHALQGRSSDLSLHQLRCHETRSWARTTLRPHLVSRPRHSTRAQTAPVIMSMGVNMPRVQQRQQQLRPTSHAPVFLRRCLQPYAEPGGPQDHPGGDAGARSTLVDRSRRPRLDIKLELSHDVAMEDSEDDTSYARATAGGGVRAEAEQPPNQSSNELIFEGIPISGFLPPPSLSRSMYASVSHAAEDHTWPLLSIAMDIDDQESGLSGSDECGGVNDPGSDPFSVAHAFPSFLEHLH
jgi:hypothetical protein